jgi:uncharacterized membrane protein
MAELVVIGYDDLATAESVLDEVQDLQRDYLIDLQDAAVVRRTDDGKLKVQTSTHATGAASLGGAFWGFLIGVLFLMPVAGLAIGGIVGALMGKGIDLGIKDDFKKQVGELVAPGKSAILMVIRQATTDRVLEELAPYGGTVLRSSLSHDDEEALVAALSGK